MFSLVAQRGELPITEPAGILFHASMDLHVVPEAASVLQLLPADQVWALIFFWVLNKYEIISSQNVALFILFIV